MFCCKACFKPKCGCDDDDEEEKKRPFLLRLMRREFVATVCCVGLSVMLIVAVATPWYTIEGYGLKPPQDTVTAVIWWKGMECLFVPPVNGHRTMTLHFEDMDSRMVKDIYHSSVAMAILAFVFNNVLLVTIIFGLGCKGTAKLLDKMTCGWFKWVVVALAFFTLTLVVLSWAIFLLINTALQRADLCVGKQPYFPVNLAGFGTTNDTLPIICDGYWCIGFGGTAKTGKSRFAWGPSVGWVCAVAGTALSFFVFCMALTIDQHRFKYETIGSRSKRSNRKSKRQPSDTKMSRRYTFEEEEEERRPLKSDKLKDRGSRVSRRDNQSESEEEEDVRSSRSSSKSRKSSSSSNSKKSGSKSGGKSGFKRVEESDGGKRRSSRR